MKQIFSNKGLCLHNGMTETIRLSIDKDSSSLKSFYKVNLSSDIMVIIQEVLKGEVQCD